MCALVCAGVCWCALVRAGSCWCVQQGGLFGRPRFGSRRPPGPPYWCEPKGARCPPGGCISPPGIRFATMAADKMGPPPVKKVKALRAMAKAPPIQPARTARYLWGPLRTAHRPPASRPSPKRTVSPFKCNGYFMPSERRSLAGMQTGEPRASYLSIVRGLWKTDWKSAQAGYQAPS